MLLIMCEKPSQARNFAKALGGMSGTFDNETYTIHPLRGHVYEFVAPDKQVSPALASTYHTWSLDTLPWDATQFQWRRQMIKGCSSIVKDVTTAAKSCDELVVATDDDPSGEGQLLAFEVLLENHIKVPKFSRMYFVDESVPEIQKAFKQRKTIPSLVDDADYRKAYYRTRWDLLSMQWSRIATLCGDKKTVLRQGRLKSAMVLLVGQQIADIAAYKRVPSYSVRFRDENGIVYTNPNEPVFPKKDQVTLPAGDDSVILDAKQTKHTAPPRLIDLAALSAALAPKGVSAKQVLNIIQKMYESQTVSYPRTEDKYITPEQFDQLAPKVDAIARVVGVDPALLTHRQPRKTHVKTGCAHGANRPGLVVPSSLAELDVKFGDGAGKIYELLAKRYLAMLAEDYVYEHQAGHLQKHPEFLGSSNIAVTAGWHAVAESDDDAKAGSGLGHTASPFVFEGFPPKPATPTMKWLMTQLEKRNVGTGATRTSTFADVTNSRSKYPLLVEKRGKISMAHAGEMSYYLLPGTHIGDLSMTEQVVSEMDEVAQGSANPEALLDRVADMVRDDIEVMKTNGVVMRKELGIMAQEYEQKEKVTGTWNGAAVAFNRSWGGHRFSDDEVAALLAGDEISITGLVSKAGKPYGVTGRLADLEYNGHKYVGFDRTGFADSGVFPAEWCKHKFTKDEQSKLEAGETVHIEGAVSKKGNTFDVDVTYGTTDDGRKSIIPQFAR